MAFKPNYRQQRAERDRQARAKQVEKLKKVAREVRAAQGRAGTDAGSSPRRAGAIALDREPS